MRSPDVPAPVHHPGLPCATVVLLDTAASLWSTAAVMNLSRRTIVAALFAGMPFHPAGPAVQAVDTPSASLTQSRAALTERSFTSLHKLIRPQTDEWRHLGVQWMTDIVPVRKKAAAEDKPIVVLYTGGAGYNEPLGVC